MAVVATDQCTLAVSVDVESVQTWYMQVAASASAPAKPTVADPTSLGWTTTEPGFDAANSKKLYTCQKTTLTDGTFMWGVVQLSSSYTGASTALNTANAAATAASNAEKVATNYITALSGNGIWVTPSDAKPSAQGAATSTTSGWHIADAIELFKSGLCYIKAWVENSVAKVRIGLASSSHVLIDDESISMKNGASLSTILQMGGSSEAVDLDGNGQTDPFVSFMPVNNSPYVAGSYSFATGFSQAGGNYSIAMDEAEADGERSFAVGQGASAEGYGSRALGYTARAVGHNSQAIGYNVTAWGNYSFAGGLGTKAGEDYLQGVGSFAYGRYLSTGLVDGAVAFGSYNDISHAPLFSFGNGTSQSIRSNLFEVLQNGNAWFSGEVQDGSGNTLSSKADASHVHAASDVTSGTLDAARIPSLPMSKITDLQTTLDGKAASSHTHAAGDVTTGTFAAARIPSLAISKITNLQTTLDGKQAAGDYWSASKGDTSYWGLVNPDGVSTGWARTPGSGLLPAASGGGSSSLGTSAWPFTNLHAQNIYHNGTKLGTAATHNHGDYVASTDSRVGSIESTNTEIRITSLNGLLRLTLTSGNNLRVDTRASTSDEWTNGLYYPGVAPVNETTMANVMTQTSTQSTNNPITAAKYYKVNSVSMVEITFKPAAARSAGTAISLGTIVSGKRPHLQAFGGSDRIMGSITSAGVCNLYVRTALTANTAYTIGFTYTT